MYFFTQTFFNTKKSIFRYYCMYFSTALLVFAFCFLFFFCLYYLLLCTSHKHLLLRSLILLHVLFHRPFSFCSQAVSCPLLFIHLYSIQYSVLQYFAGEKPLRMTKSVEKLAFCNLGLAILFLRSDQRSQSLHYYV